MVDREIQEEKIKSLNVSKIDTSVKKESSSNKKKRNFSALA
jgi:hypothetical protein